VLELAQIEKMSASERLQAMEQLWEVLCRDGEAIESPEWHRDVLAERRARVARVESKFLTLGQLKDRLRGSQS
jgi:hypothetical protein